MAHTPPKRSWANTSSKNVLQNYDQSPIDSPSHTPPRAPTFSRHGSAASISSTRSEPAFESENIRSAPKLPESGSLRREHRTTAPQPEASDAHSHKKHGLKGIFASKKTPEEKAAEKRKRQWEREKKKLEHKKDEDEARRKAYDWANKAKNRDSNRDARRDSLKHPRPKAKTAGITTYTSSALGSPADQEARYPHSGRPSVAVNGKQDAELTRIESQDQPDDELDTWQKRRQEWNQTHEDNDLGDILEARSRQASRISSPWASPGASREASPNRLGVMRPSMASKRNSWHGGFQRDPTSGRWTKQPSPPQKTSPGRLTPIHPSHEGVNADLLAKSLAERLKMSV